MRPDAQAALSSVIDAPVRALGLDVEGLEVREAGRRLIVRVVIDRDGGVDLDSVAAASSAVSAALDESPDAQKALGDRAYVLEVSSPGVDRPLREPRHWRRAIGRMVVVTLRDGRTVEGRIDSVADDSVTVGDLVIEFTSIDRGIVQVEFGSRGDE